nr:hypothetical protein [Tanacetum cinerariifolium]
MVGSEADIMNYTKSGLGGDIDMLKVGQGRKRSDEAKDNEESKKSKSGVVEESKQDEAKDNEESKKSKSGVVEEKMDVLVLSVEMREHFWKADTLNTPRRKRTWQNCYTHRKQATERMRSDGPNLTLHLRMGIGF